MRTWSYEYVVGTLEPLREAPGDEVASVLQSTEIPERGRDLQLSQFPRTHPASDDHLLAREMNAPAGMGDEQVREVVILDTFCPSGQ